MIAPVLLFPVVFWDLTARFLFSQRRQNCFYNPNHAISLSQSLSPSIIATYLPTTSVISERHRVNCEKANWEGVILFRILNWRQKWEVCLKPRSKATFFTDSPESNKTCAD